MAIGKSANCRAVIANLGSKDGRDGHRDRPNFETANQARAKEMKQFTDTVVSREEVDAVVVGARVGGAATAIALARRGRKVIALDRAKFPSDTISTHVLFATGVAELKWLGACSTRSRSR
jgi:hypothetical protein